MDIADALQIICLLICACLVFSLTDFKLTGAVEDLVIECGQRMRFSLTKTVVLWFSNKRAVGLRMRWNVIGPRDERILQAYNNKDELALKISGVNLVRLIVFSKRVPGDI